MQRVQDQDNGINIKFGPGKSRKGDYRLVAQESDNNKDRLNGTNKPGERKMPRVIQYINIYTFVKKQKKRIPLILPPRDICLLFP